jgi:hypothetical protein
MEPFMTVHYNSSVEASLQGNTKGIMVLLMTVNNYGEVEASMTAVCLVVSVEDYKHRVPGFDSRALSIFLRELGLERGPLSLVIV